MIYNQHLDRLMEVQSVQDFVKQHHMHGSLCGQGDSCSFILFRHPYVIEFYDALIENYLNIYFVDLSSGLLLEGGSALARSVDLGLQNLAELQKRDFSAHPQKDVFLSFFEAKAGYLECELQAIDKLFPLIEAKGGLASMRDGLFDSRFDFSDSIKPMYSGLRERYQKSLHGDIDAAVKLPNPVDPA